MRLFRDQTGADLSLTAEEMRTLVEFVDGNLHRLAHYERDIRALFEELLKQAKEQKY
jgi:hypothetical protein